MADTDFHGADYGAEAPSRFVEMAQNLKASNIAGAATSLALTAGVAVWAVNLTFGDVSSVPVIRALEGPMRVAPEDPGGTNMPYQGLALSDITSGGAAAPAPEQIVLAPPPVTLDAPSLAERTAALDEATAEEAAELAAETTIAPIDTPLDAESETLIAELAALADEDDGMSETTRLIADLQIVSADADIDLTEEEAQDAGAKFVQAINPLEPGLSTSTRPRTRPAALRAVAATQPSVSPLAAPEATGQQVASLPTANDVSTAPIPVGTRVVQLGAFDSEAIARAEWQRLSGRFGDYLSGHAPVVQKAQSGGRDFWRLRVTGFGDAAQARRLCTALLAQQQACISVVVR